MSGLAIDGSFEPLYTPEALRQLVDQALNSILSERDWQNNPVLEAAAYSLLAPGKRLRPVLTLAVALEFGCTPEKVIHSACAVEFIHTASLILDDLPSMDNAMLRRGLPTNHIKFGEDISLLAVISLLCLAVEIVSNDWRIGIDKRLQVVNTLFKATGPNGLVLGQAHDLRLRQQPLSFEVLEAINQRKTAELFQACGEIGALVAGATEEQQAKASRIGRELGLAFQVMDDCLDQLPEALAIGKDVAKDVGKSTFASQLSKPDIQRLLERHHQVITSNMQEIVQQDVCWLAESPLHLFMAEVFMRQPVSHLS